MSRGNLQQGQSSEHRTPRPIVVRFRSRPPILVAIHRRQTLTNDTYSPWCDRPCQGSNGPMAKREDILMRFGQRVRELRKDQGYSQENFAYACGLDRTYMGGH